MVFLTANKSRSQPRFFAWYIIRQLRHRGPANEGLRCCHFWRELPQIAMGAKIWRSLFELQRLETTRFDSQPRTLRPPVRTLTGWVTTAKDAVVCGNRP